MYDTASIWVFFPVQKSIRIDTVSVIKKQFSYSQEQFLMHITYTMQINRNSAAATVITAAAAHIDIDS